MPLSKLRARLEPVERRVDVIQRMEAIKMRREDRRS
jgi:hypothetical protein